MCVDVNGGERGGEIREGNDRGQFERKEEERASGKVMAGRIRKSRRKK